VTAMAATAETAPTVAGEAIAPWVLELARRRRERPEPTFVAALRRRALERFGTLGFPSPRQEAWRGTSVKSIAETAFAEACPLSPEGARAAESALAPYLFEAAATLVFVDGRFAPHLSRIPLLGEGVIATSLAEALARHPDLLEPHLGRHAGFDQASFVALNTALFEDGAFLSLPRGAVLPGPVHLVFGMTGTGGAEGRAAAAFPRNLLVIGENAQATLVETYVDLAPGGAEPVYLTCGATELVAGPGAVVDHYKVQRESREAFHVATFELVEGRASNVSSHSLTLGGGLVRNDVNALLDGEGSETILNGLYVIGGRQHVDNHMRVEHAKPHCASHELYKGILDGRARAVFNGLIHVRHGAQKTDAKQSNRNLLLSPDAVANSNPQLEIFADDVRCTHGSTVGQLDDDAVFYLRSRGIGEEAARSILTYAFASDIVERIKVPAVRRDLEEYLFTRLPKGDVVRQSV
jgi:Fe-S cluster assembly protein SufD